MSFLPSLIPPRKVYDFLKKSTIFSDQEQRTSDSRKLQNDRFAQKDWCENLGALISLVIELFCRCCDIIISPQINFCRDFVSQKFSWYLDILTNDVMSSYLTIIPRVRMGSESIAHEANQLVKNIENKKILAS